MRSCRTRLSPGPSTHRARRSPSFRDLIFKGTLPISGLYTPSFAMNYSHFRSLRTLLLNISGIATIPSFPASMTCSRLNALPSTVISGLLSTMTLSDSRKGPACPLPGAGFTPVPRRNPCGSPVLPHSHLVCMPSPLPRRNPTGFFLMIINVLQSGNV